MILVEINEKVIIGLVICFIGIGQRTEKEK